MFNNHSIAIFFTRSDQISWSYLPHCFTRAQLPYFTSNDHIIWFYLSCYFHRSIAIFLYPQWPNYFIIVAILFTTAQLPHFLPLVTKLFDPSCHVILSPLNCHIFYSWWPDYLILIEILFYHRCDCHIFSLVTRLFDHNCHIFFSIAQLPYCVHLVTRLYDSNRHVLLSPLNCHIFFTSIDHIIWC